MNLSLSSSLYQSPLPQKSTLAAFETGPKVSSPELGFPKCLTSHYQGTETL